MTGPGAVEFIHDVTVADLPRTVVDVAGRALLDLLGVAAAGSATPLSRIVRAHAVRWGAVGPGGGARLLFDGRRVGPVAAAAAGAATIDSLDAHDGHSLTKGHAGVAVLPAVLACAELGPDLSGAEFLTALVVGYEVALRAGIALHASAGSYHCSGAWNVLGAAAVAARLLRLNSEQTRHALGIAEYHGPRGLMMRCIEYPTMVKDGSDQGAAAGLNAALLAAEGFTGAPAVTLQDATRWDDLGRRWRIQEQYFKPYPVCRWAHPAIDAALELRRAGPLAIVAAEVVTFHEAAQLTCRRPITTEQAQYSLPFPVAATLVHGEPSVSGEILSDEAVLRLAGSMVISESPEFSAAFPAVRSARVILRLADNRTLNAESIGSHGDPEDPLTGQQLAAKFHRLADPVLGAQRGAQLETACAGLLAEPHIQLLRDQVLSAT